MRPSKTEADLSRSRGISVMLCRPSDSAPTLRTCKYSFDLAHATDRRSTTPQTSIRRRQRPVTREVQVVASGCRLKKTCTVAAERRG